MIDLHAACVPPPLRAPAKRVGRRRGSHLEWRVVERVELDHHLPLPLTPTLRRRAPVDAEPMAPPPPPPRSRRAAPVAVAGGVGLFEQRGTALLLAQTEGNLQRWGGLSRAAEATARLPADEG